MGTYQLSHHKHNSVWSRIHIHYPIHNKPDARGLIDLINIYIRTYFDEIYESCFSINLSLKDNYLYLHNIFVIQIWGNFGGEFFG